MTFRKDSEKRHTMSDKTFIVKMTPQRADKFSRLRLVLEENAQSKAIDAAVEIALNLYYEGDLARAQWLKIVPDKYLTKFILKNSTVKRGDTSERH